MKTFLMTIYAIVMSVVILILLYAVNPYVIGNPKIALGVLIFFMLTSIGAGFRSMIELCMLSPMLKIADGINKSFSICTIVFAISMVIAIILPWINGVSDFTVWNWFASIEFTIFCFETFFSFFGASLRVYKDIP